MATLVVNTSVGLDFDTFDLNELNNYANVSTSATVFRLFDTASTFTRFTGTGLVFNGANDPTSGTFTTWEESQFGLQLFSVTDLSLSAATFWSYVNAGNTAGGLAYVFSGADTMTGSNSGDRLRGYSGNDTLRGGGDADFLYGMMGNDTLNGGPGADIMRGGVGNDNYYIDAADNIAELANQGVDHVFAAFSHQLGANFEHLTLLGAFNVNATGNGVANTLTGNSGNNVLDGRAGADVMRGGAGNDTYIVDNAGDQITENAGEGVDTVQSSVTWTLGANLENLVLTGMAAINGVGNAANNDITGNGAANILNGGAGADIMRGGDGNDRYYVNIAGDQVIENDNEGTDGVFSSVSYALGAFIENLALTGAANINGVGNGLANRITGNSGANIINGLNGLDILTGGAGGDVFVFSTALGPTNIDQITDFNPVNDRIALDDAIFTAAGAAGALAAGAFRIGAAATDADDRILYDSASGQLLYDADGNGGGAAEHFATLSAGLALTASDFFII